MRSLHISFSSISQPASFCRRLFSEPRLSRTPPPMAAFSMQTTLAPSSAAEHAANRPDVPAPHTSTSVSMVSTILSSGISGSAPSQSFTAAAASSSFVGAALGAHPASPAPASAAAVAPKPRNARRLNPFVAFVMTLPFLVANIVEALERLVGTLSTLRVVRRKSVTRAE